MRCSPYLLVLSPAPKIPKDLKMCYLWNLDGAKSARTFTILERPISG